jgi:hypothetical protein
LEVLPAPEGGADTSSSVGQPTQKRGPADPNATNYLLAIDLQVEKFVDTKQKLTYFLITASTAVTAFVVKFYIDYLTAPRTDGDAQADLRFLVCSAFAGLLTAGFSLLNLHLEHRSYSLHLGYRYQGMDWPLLTPAQREAWDQITSWARRFLAGAFICLFLQIALGATFFVLLFTKASQ